METRNTFYRNLGAKTGAPQYIIPGDENTSNGVETDGEPSTFWITNPTNFFRENVSAGSANSGFWFEPKLRGNRMSHFVDIIDPQHEQLLEFKDNVVHSSGFNGTEWVSRG